VSNDTRADVVSRQYERWRYPPPVEDLAAWSATNWDWFEDALSTLTADRPIQSYLKIAYDLRDDAALVDTFLHRRARNYTVDECLDFVASAGLAFQVVSQDAVLPERPVRATQWVPASR
jgi:hypothetical protein